MVNNGKEHVCVVQTLVPDKLRHIHVPRMWRYADDQLETTSELLKIFQQLDTQLDYYIRNISAIKRTASGDDLVVDEAWEGLEEAQNIWIPVSRMVHDKRTVLPT